MHHLEHFLAAIWRFYSHIQRAISGILVKGSILTLGVFAFVCINRSGRRENENQVSWKAPLILK